ncbi:MAG: adenylate/guanylate cyclase domain-containing protein [Devosia sp.]|uniref:CHASE2 domain-containing protein n=1 Tax=Devosia sp. TaxID=1871048 RepID=UPI0024CCB785|nr:adenylate/guanylate cyclase domain-containing protein [Devosia sp.]UYN99205.1 MAG: adenylate/guanylate cyclase domain-containing protein [Devosia sp.]
MRSLLPLAAGLLIAGLGTILVLHAPPSVALLREKGLDWLVLAMPVPQAEALVVVDIGLENEAGNPWSRDDTARLIGAVSAASPTAIGLDMVLSGECDAGAAANQTLAEAMAGTPVVLGFLLTATPSAAPVPQPALALMADLSLPRILYADGAETACAGFSDMAASAAGLPLLGDGDGLVRQVPAVMAIGGRPFLGLAFDMARQAHPDAPPVLAGNPAWLRLGSRVWPLSPAGSVRFRPSAPDHWATRTIAAADLLDGSADAARLGDALVLVGSSAPRAGALRATAASPITPSVQIHADLLSGLLGGRLPIRAELSPRLEAAAAGLGGVTAALAGAVLAPALAGAVTLALAALGIGTAFGLAIFSGLLLDPFIPALVILAAGIVTTIAQAVRTRAAEQALRRRIGQLLPAEVVRRFVADPSLFRMEGEVRQVTALFTDIEGFSAATQGMEPKKLVSLMDAYFSGMTGIILAHGGMVEKLVGDAIHALFNAPADLDGHVDRAIACALALQAHADAFRQRADMAPIGLGRTRIGVETGEAILGDVGSGDKIDYTAYGDAVNMAARLEEACKQLGAGICIGPNAAHLASVTLVELGEIDLRSFGHVRVFGPRRP